LSNFHAFSFSSDVVGNAAGPQPSIVSAARGAASPAAPSFFRSNFKRRLSAASSTLGWRPEANRQDRGSVLKAFCGFAGRALELRVMPPEREP
jgi:hypothetical protein